MVTIKQYENIIKELKTTIELLKTNNKICLCNECKHRIIFDEVPEDYIRVIKYYNRDDNRKRYGGQSSNTFIFHKICWNEMIKNKQYQIE